MQADQDPSVIESYTIPHHVSTTTNPDNETPQQVEERHSRFLTLPEIVQDKLAHPETGRRIFKIGREFHFDLMKTAVIARAVRSYYFSELPQGQISWYIAKETGIASDVAQKLASSVVHDIIRWDLPQSEASESPGASPTQKLTFDQLFKKYPKILDTPITENDLFLKGTPKPVAPTIKNWITAYHQEVGAGTHETFERGNFLFQSKNTQHLSPLEKTRLMELFKALDENTTLSIDSESQKIVFTERSPVIRGDAPKMTSSADMSSPGSDNQTIHQDRPVRPASTTMEKQTPPTDPSNSVARLGLPTIQRAQGGSHDFSSFTQQNTQRRKPQQAPETPQGDSGRPSLRLSPAYTLSSLAKAPALPKDDDASIAQKAPTNKPNIHFSSPHKLPGE